MKNKKTFINISIDEKGQIDINTNIVDDVFTVIGVIETVKGAIINTNSKKHETFKKGK